MGAQKLYSSCRTVQVLPECLRLNKVPAVHCSIAIPLGQPRNPEITPLSRRVSQVATDPQEENDPCAQSLLLTGAPGCPTGSVTGTPVPLAAVQPDPWLRPATVYSPNQQDQNVSRTRRRSSQDDRRGPNKKTTETDKPPNKTGGREIM